MSNSQNLHNLRRAAEERAKAAMAVNDEKKQLHLELARIFEMRVEPDARDTIH